MSEEIIFSKRLSDALALIAIRSLKAFEREDKRSRRITVVLDEIHRLDAEIEERKRKISTLTDELGKIVVEREKQNKTGGR